MELSLKDRVLLLKFVLPDFDVREKMALKISISKKIVISESDNNRIVAKDMGGGRYNIGFTDVEAITDKKDIPITDSELLYLKQLIDFQDKNGMFSEFNFETYTKVIDAPFENQDYQLAWEKYLSPPATYPEFRPTIVDSVDEQQEIPVDPNVIIEKHIDRVPNSK